MRRGSDSVAFELDFHVTRFSHTVAAVTFRITFALHTEYGTVLSPVNGEPFTTAFELLVEVSR
jgi:hypothetical protein